MKKCELCTAAAATYCASDSAHLCWECDARVHSANFLVERHSRTLLCRLCQLPTSWSASGSRLSKTVSVCQRCVTKKEEREEEREERDDCVTEEKVWIEDEDEDDVDDDDDDDEDEDEDDDEEDEEEDDDVKEGEGEEQVVPEQMSSTRVCLKRLRDVECCSDDEFGSTTNDRNAISYSARDNEADCVDSFNSNSYKRLKTQPGPGCMFQIGLTNLKTSSNAAETVIIETCNMDQNTLAIVSESADSS